MIDSLFRRTLVTFVFGAVTLAASVAHAQTPVAGKGTLTAAIVPNYPPFEYKDPATDELTGFDVDLGVALAAKMGVKLKWEETSFDQMMNALTTHRVDMILSGMTDLPTRREAVNFLDYIKTGPQFYTLKARGGEFASMDAVCGKRVGSSRRTSFPDDTKNWSDEHCVKDGSMRPCKGARPCRIRTRSKRTRTRRSVSRSCRSTRPSAWQRTARL